MLSKLTQDSYSYWIGLYQNTHDSGFTWKDGTALDYENWNDYEPNNSGGMEGCVTVDKWSGGRWNDDHCAKLKGWVCKKLRNATPAPPTTPMPTKNCPDGEALLK